MNRARPKIAFVSPHCLVDFSNGAAIATREGLKLLAAQGIECMAFCGTRLDEASEGLIQEQLFRRKIKYMVRKVRIPVSRAQRPLPNTAYSPLPDGKAEYELRLIFLAEGNVRSHPFCKRPAEHVV